MTPSFSSALALVWMATTFAAALMIVAARSTSRVARPRPRRCPACGRLVDRGRCRCTGPDTY